MQIWAQTQAPDSPSSPPAPRAAPTKLEPRRIPGWGARGLGKHPHRGCVTSKLACAEQDMVTPLPHLRGWERPDPRGSRLCPPPCPQALWDSLLAGMVNATGHSSLGRGTPGYEHPAADLNGEVWGQSKGLGAPGSGARGSSALDISPLASPRASPVPCFIQGTVQAWKAARSVKAHIWQRRNYVPRSPPVSCVLTPAQSVPPPPTPHWGEPGCVTCIADMTNGDF